MKKRMMALLVALTLLISTVCCGIGTVFATGDTLPQTGGTLLVTTRPQETAGVRQYITEALETAGKGTYEFSCWVRLRSTPESTVKVWMIVENTTDAGKTYPSVNLDVNDTQWHHIVGTTTANWGDSELTQAMLYTQTACCWAARLTLRSAPWRLAASAL